MSLSPQNNRILSSAVRDAIRAYNQFIDGTPLGGLAREQDTLEYLLASIRHYCAQQGIDYAEVDAKSAILYNIER